MLGAEALEKDLASPVFRPRVKVGDLVHVFEGSGAGLVRGRDVDWFGKVVGVEGENFFGEEPFVKRERASKPCLRATPTITNRFRVRSGQWRKGALSYLVETN